jgi:hypothetical protein
MRSRREEASDVGGGGVGALTRTFGVPVLAIGIEVIVDRIVTHGARDGGDRV